MILLPDKKILLITPPRCGSTSLHYALCEQGNGVYVMGPQLDAARHIEKHTFALPHQAIHYKKYIVVRNPYDRITSFYAHYSKYTDKPLTFAEYIETRVIPHKDVDCYPISSAIDRMDYYYIDRHLKIEDINTGLKNIGIDINIPKLNSSNKPPLHWTPDLRFLIKTWGSNDFVRFNYSRSCSMSTL